jgi:hypothetical protein
MAILEVTRRLVRRVGGDKVWRTDIDPPSVLEQFY